MIPCGGFMQAVPGAAPSALGGKSGSTGSIDKELLDTQNANPSVDGGAGSFLAWVQQLMADDASGQTDAQSILNGRLHETGSDKPVPDPLRPLMADDASGQTDAQSVFNGRLPEAGSDKPVPEQLRRLMADDASGQTDAQSVFNGRLPEAGSEKPVPDPLRCLIAEAMDPSAPGTSDAQALYAESLGDGQTLVAPWTLQTVVAQDAADPVSGLPVRSTLSELQKLMAASGNPTAGASSQPVASESALQTRVDDASLQTATVDGDALKANPIALPGEENTLQDALEKQDTASALKPVPPPGKENHDGSHQLLQERIASGAGISKHASQPTSTHPHAMAGQAQDPDSLARIFAGEKASSSQDDATGFNGRDRQAQTRQVESADGGDGELQKHQALDGLKNGQADPTKALPTLHDTAKSMADALTQTADKTNPGQTAGLSRTDASEARAFQTTVMDQIVDKAVLRSIHGRSEIQISLKPEFLGKVQMNITNDKEHLMVRILTDQPLIKEIIETHLHQLKTELQNQGLTIDKFEVMVNPDAQQQQNSDQTGQMFKNNSSQNGRRQPQAHGRNARDRGEDPQPEETPPDRDGVNYFA